eukprot:EC797098.1.p5 GENE.EC797098.1~~EC797098.1.p5  ORF type:complete len:56 (-),score=7.34 EC797098.1:409-576(-)
MSHQSSHFFSSDQRPHSHTEVITPAYNVLAIRSNGYGTYPVCVSRQLKHFFSLLQ